MPGESSTALALSLSPRAMNLSLASVCVDDDGASNASKAKAPAPTAMARDGASVLLERLVASSNEHGERLDEQSTLLKGAVEALSDRLTVMEASLGGLHAKLDAAERRTDGRVDVLDEMMASCREEVAALAARTTKTRTAVATALAALTTDSAANSVAESVRDSVAESAADSAFGAISLQAPGAPGVPPARMRLCRRPRDGKP